MKNFKIFLILTLFSLNSFADVLKPALVEVTIFKKTLELQITLNLEALLSEINTNLKNAKNAKNQDFYQALRVLKPQELTAKFLKYQTIFTNKINFKIDGKKASLVLKNIDIASVGYTKRDRKSILTFVINAKVKEKITWQYAKIYGDSAFRFRFFQKDAYTWNTWQIIKDKIEININNFKPLTTFKNLVKFIQTGFYHVIPLGLDHILFIIAMSLIATSFWKIIILVSGFTVAHTLSLALASLDIIVIGSQIIEPLIAITIILIGTQNLFLKHQQQREIIIVFIFGLLHGLGFAVMLKSFISDSFVSSLIGFNLGVEFAQILIVSLVLLLLFLITKINIKLRFITIPANIIIVVIASFMLLTRW